MSNAVAGRFVLLCCTYEDGMKEPEWGFCTSWDSWEECCVAFPIAPGFKLHDDETGREWLANTPYEWEAART